MLAQEEIEKYSEQLRCILYGVVDKPKYGVKVDVEGRPVRGQVTRRIKTVRADAFDCDIDKVVQEVCRVLSFPDYEFMHVTVWSKTGERRTYEVAGEMNVYMTKESRGEMIAQERGGGANQGVRATDDGSKFIEALGFAVLGVTGLGSVSEQVGPMGVVMQIQNSVKEKDFELRELKSKLQDREEKLQEVKRALEKSHDELEKLKRWQESAKGELARRGEKIKKYEAAMPEREKWKAIASSVAAPLLAGVAMNALGRTKVGAALTGMLGGLVDEPTVGAEPETEAMDENVKVEAAAPVVAVAEEENEEQKTGNNEV